MTPDLRAAAAERALAAHGVDARVQAEGAEGQVAAVALRTAADLAALLDRPAATDAVRAAGFRAVAVDLALDDG